MIASRLATACSKNVKIVIGLFHNKEGNRGTCTESKGDEERFKELTHSRVDMVGHDVTHRVGQSNARDKRHDRTRNNQIICGVKTGIARPDMSQQSEDKGTGKSCHKRNADIFVHIQREGKAKEGGNGRA